MFMLCAEITIQAIMTIISACTVMLLKESLFTLVVIDNAMRVFEPQGLQL